jgi:Fe2+ transport system protein B
MFDENDYYDNKLMRSGVNLKVCFYSLIWIVVLLIVAGLVSCKTIKSVENTTENNTVVTTDSTNTSSVKQDSTVIEHNTNTTEKEKTHTESHTEKKDSMVTVVDQNGNVIGTKEFHWLRETLREVSEREKSLEDYLSIYRHRYDSLGYYKAKFDSLSHEKNHEKIVEVEKERSLKDKISTFISDAILGVFIFILVIFVIRLIKKRLWR